RNLALDIFADLAVSIAQLLGNIAGQILIYLDDLQLYFRDFALRLCCLSDDLPALSLEPRFLALQRSEPIELDQIRRPRIAPACELPVDEGGGLVVGRVLGGEASDLLL